MISVRPARFPQSNRGSVAVGAQKLAAPITYPAPSQGLHTSVSMGSSVTGSASVLTNFLPTVTGSRIRGGSMKTAKGADGTALRWAGKYKQGNTEAIFMASETAIYNMTAPATLPSTQSAAVSGMTSSDWASFQHTTADGAFLIMVNGEDPRQLFNGSTWSTTPAITFPDTTTSDQLGYGFTFNNREFYTKNGSLDVYYLATSAVGGAATVFPLGGVVKKGGSILTGFSWAIESGDGLADYCVFVTTEGEVVIYAGSDPSSSTNFALKGVYQVGRPLGKNAWLRQGGDILLCTVDGLIRLSGVFQRDQLQLSIEAISRPIDTEWKGAALLTGTGWTITPWVEQSVAFVTFPDNTYLPDTTFVLNLVTGKWGLITGWSALCYTTRVGNLYFGSDEGFMWQGDTGGNDDSQPFTATYLSSFESGGDYGLTKRASSARLYIKCQTPPSVKLFARSDFNTDTPAYDIITYGEVSETLWDVSLWDVDVWDGSQKVQRFSFKQNVRASGKTLAVGCVVVSGGDTKIDMELDLALLQVEVGDSQP